MSAFSAMLRSDSAPELSREQPWRILSLDGGGVRGLAELLILERIFNTMETIVANELGGAARPFLPSDFFDLIGGTSTGGLIALLLGRLRMSVPEAVANFRSLSQHIFPASKGNWFSKRVALATAKTYYDASVLEAEIRKLLQRRTGDPETRMIEEDDPACRVFVCATRMHTTSSILLRTYTPRDPGQANPSVKVWEAARATSAAPPLFEPITIQDCGLTLLDGAFRLNNPVNETLSEACDIAPHRDYGCVISIGTGVADVPSLENSRFLLKVAHACVQISLDCEDVAAKFVKGPTGRRINEEGRYFRFNVPRRLHAVNIDDWEKHEAVQEYVETYLETMSQQLDKCARTLLVLSGYPVRPHASSSELPVAPRTPSSPPNTSWDTTNKASDTATVSHLSLGGVTTSNVSISSFPYIPPLPTTTTIHGQGTLSILSGTTLGGTPPADPIPAAATAALKNGSHHLALKQYNVAFDQFKLALSQLKLLPGTSESVLSALVAAHLGVSDALVQAACAKQRNAPKAMAHLRSAEQSVTRALEWARKSTQGIHMKQVELSFVVIAITKAELEAEHGIMDAVQAGCLQGKIDELVRGVGDTDESVVLKRKAEAWRRRLKVKHGGFVELPGSEGGEFVELPSG
ncbi:acyl transferase/acyl hydrolase/lysophospholipase [Podospora aff. communis PSN243]|uniref:Acyl transferase/acyl hydrolase/lysophospholipase n=1 Tax=Podospora aff. communis PSN243 TaxID=3040156 RepID=A0AAV9GLN8_9PEZI|nr:acyl transferase/acyl hydrolase/lysophospholipase [Podospora aff. communis PSN243]